MIDPRQLAPIDTSSPAGATRLLWQARHSLDTANIEAFAGTGAMALDSSLSGDCPRPARRFTSSTADHTTAAAKTATRPRLIATSRRIRRRTSPTTDRPAPADGARRAG